MNKVILMGRLIAGPEVRYTQNNHPVARFRLAVNRPKQRDKEQEADFIDIVGWNYLANFAGKYFKKGMQVLVEGQLRINSWTDKENQRHYKTEILADSLHFADSRRGNGEAPSASAGREQVGQQKDAPADAFYALNEDDEDLPF